MAKEWAEYISARDKGIKPLWKPLLDERIRHISSLKGKDEEEYIEELCVEYFDNEMYKIPIQHPEIWKRVLDLWSRNVDDNDERYLLRILKAISYDGVYKILMLDPVEILERVLTINPYNQAAEKLLYKEYLDQLDFALHELPSGLLAEEEQCSKVIERCESMVRINPELVESTSRFNVGLEHYKKVFYGWLEYKNSNSKEEFCDWLRNKI